MKLKMLYERALETFYKGMNERDFRKFKRHNIPGFMAGKYLAMIYAQPALANDPDETMYFISAPIGMDGIQELWSAPGSGFGGKMAIYCGQPVSWELEAVFHGEEEWKEAFGALPED